jgi:hypothetical protein
MCPTNVVGEAVGVATMSLNEEFLLRAQDYAQQRQMTIAKELGSGVHGAVFSTVGQSIDGRIAKQSAVKVYESEVYYYRERDIYLRLQRRKLSRIRACEVPKLLNYDDLLLIIEMTIVSRPFVLDFAGAYLDKAPEFSEEVMADALVIQKERFGKHWHEVQRILAVLEVHGIYMEDVHPGNIAFVDAAKTSSSSS